MRSFELDFVEWLRRRVGPQPGVVVGIGDDMAILRDHADQPNDVAILVSSDMLLDGVHFQSDRHSLRDVGRKAIACSLSDCAAMAVRPLAATISTAFPATMPLESACELYEGMLAMASEFELAVAGGDTTRWSHPLAIDVAITAQPFEGIAPIRRSGAAPGDLLYVTGTLGGSILGKHLSFRPRVREARILAEQFGAQLHALMDVTDGLSLDLWRMCQASGAGAAIEECLLEKAISDDAVKLSMSDGRSPLDHALRDGEDFELLAAIAPEADVSGFLSLENSDSPNMFPIGRITEKNFVLIRLDGTSEPLEPQGYVH